MGAVILNKQCKPLSYGYNNTNKTNPMMVSLNYDEFKIYPHAEIAACIANGDKFGYKDQADAAIVGRMKVSDTRHKNQILIVARLDASNKCTMAKPCIHCQDALKGKFDEIYYTDRSGSLVLLNI